VLLSLIGFLLEQGSNLLSLGTKHSAFFCITTCTFISSLILSNAFKGENINQITSPLRVVTHDKIEELLKYNYNIYSGFVRENYFGDEIIKTNQSLVAKFVNDVINDKMDSQSELVFNSGNSNKPLNKLLQNQIVLPHVTVFCTNVNQLLVHEPPNFANIFEGLKQVCYWPPEYATELGKCNKTALIEEESFLRYFAIPLLKQDAESNAIYNIGKTVLFEKIHGLFFKHYKMPNSGNILNHLEASGIVAYLNSLGDEYLKKSAMFTLNLANVGKINHWDKLFRELSQVGKTREEIEINRKKILRQILNLLGIVRESLELREDQNHHPVSVSVSGNFITLFILVSILHVSCIWLFIGEVIHKRVFEYGFGMKTVFVIICRLFDLMKYHVTILFSIFSNRQIITKINVSNNISSVNKKLRSVNII